MGACLSSTSKKEAPAERKRRVKAPPEKDAAAEAPAVEFGYERDFQGRYEVGRLLGHGQFGYTFAAVDRLSGDRVAVKRIDKSKMTRPVAVEDVKREVKILKALKGHENIVHFDNAFEDDSYVYIVMELCEGGELLDRILAKKNSRYSEKDAAVVVRQMLKVAAECHLRGLVHRDMKPENFLFKSTKEDSPLKATDFGLSDFIKPGKKFRDIVGSAYYVAPEVLKRRSGPESDVWSIGVITYILLCGRRPFWDKTEDGIFKEVLRNKPDFRKRPWPSISSSAKDFVKKLLVKNPRARLTAAQALSHPWVREGGDASEIPVDISVLYNMRQFVKYSRFKQFALRALASTVNEEELADLKDQFDAIDVDKNGSISIEEMRTPVQPFGPVASSALAAVELGDYAAALASAVPHILRASPPTEADYDSPAQFYGHLAAAVEVFLLGNVGGGAADEGFECRCALVLSAAVAALLAFTQQNVTGPSRKYSPFPFISTSSLDDWWYSDAGGKHDKFDSHVQRKFVPFWTSSSDDGWYSDPGGKWEAWASHHLASFGSHVHGKFLLLQFIVFAELLLTSINSLDSDISSVSWWLCRLSMSQQNILDELSSSLFDQVQIHKNKMLTHFGELERVSSYWGSFLCDGEGSSLVSAALLEAGHAEYKYGRVDASRLHLDSAQEACGIHLSLTGVLGFRTIHQVDPKSQMVLIAKTTKPAADERQSTELTGSPGVVLRKTRSSVNGESDEFCDILRTPLLAQNVNDLNSGSTQISLTPIQQAVVLAQCLHVSRRSRSDEMSDT